MGSHGEHRHGDAGHTLFLQTHKGNGSFLKTHKVTWLLGHGGPAAVTFTLRPPLTQMVPELYKTFRSETGDASQVGERKRGLEREIERDGYRESWRERES